MPYLGNIPATQFAELKYQDFTGGTGTSFTLNDPVGSAQELEVFVNNVRQEPGVAYTVSGTTLTMTGSIVATDDFYVVFQGKSTGTATHPAGQALTATVGTFTDGLTVDDDGAAPLTVDRATSDGDAIIIQKDGTTVGSIKSQNSTDISIGSADTGLRFFDSGDQIFPTTDNLTTLGRHDSRFKDLYLSGGAYLGGTAAANALDDYEEGTWTPTNASADTLSGFTVNSARYRKIGSIVYVAAYINLGTNSGTSNAAVGGLPYATANITNLYHGGTIGYSTYTNPMNVLFFPNASSVDFRAIGGSNLTNANLSNRDIIFSATYISE